jgi:hypothetical protein
VFIFACPKTNTKRAANHLAFGFPVRSKKPGAAKLATFDNFFSAICQLITLGTINFRHFSSL